MNPFTAHYAQCNTGDPADKWRDLPEFPHLIDVEPTSACNFRCLMCPTGNFALERTAEFMEAATFESIATQCRPYSTALRFIGWGEPLLHPLIAAFVWFASQRGLDTHLNTNGSKLDEMLALDLIRTGLKSIKFSFQGVDRKSYAEMRNKDWFEELIGRMRMFRELRGKHTLPWIAASTSITYETPEMVAAFEERVGPLVDQLGIGNTIFDYMDMSAVRLRPAERAMLEKLRAFESTNKRHPVPCPEVYDKLSIHADGSVVVCCNDYNGTVELGNVNETPIKEIWRHPKIEAYRERLARKDYNAPLCKDCYDYADLTHDHAPAVAG